jgi:hypothetical protein
MRQILDEPWKTDEWYLNQWRAFYRLRMGRLVNIYQTFGAIGITAVLFALVPESFKDRHAIFTDLFAITGGLAWVWLLVQWVWMNWQMTSWGCPRCEELFFARNPFRRRCSHCRLVRPRQRNVGSLASM